MGGNQTPYEKWENTFGRERLCNFAGQMGTLSRVRRHGPDPFSRDLSQRGNPSGFVRGPREKRVAETTDEMEDRLTARGRGVTCWLTTLFCILLEDPCIKQMQPRDSTFSVSETGLAF